jgi:hypothetical protein
MFGWGFKPPVLIIIPVLLLVSCIFDQNPVLRPLVNLAWDTGGAATGAVTVPIILSLGLGVAKTGEKNSTSSGLGLVTLASALPVAGVLFLAFLIGPNVPMPSDAAVFFSAGQREKAVYVAGSEEELVRMAEAAVESGDLSRADFYLCFPENAISGWKLKKEAPVFSAESLLGSLGVAAAAVVPLALALIISVTVIARDRILNADIAFLGILFAAIGMFALNLGMNGGITAVSSQAGRSLRRAYTTSLSHKKTVAVYGVDESSFITVPGEKSPETYIWIQGEKGPFLEKFVPSQLSGGSYTHIPVDENILFRYGALGSYLIILAVVFFLGFFAIFAEPALLLTAVTVEEMTTGIFKRKKLQMLAAVGVGGGMVIGFARVLLSNMLPEGGIHLSWLLVPCYGLALLLTVFAPEDFCSIAWDVAGIATGPISVPIIITSGLGLGNDSLRADGAFGIVAMASVFPIIIILVSGIIDQAKSKKSLRGGYGE